MLIQSARSLENSLIDSKTTDPIPRRDTTWIYFLNADDAMVKIGHSRQQRNKRQEQHAKAKFGVSHKIETLCEVRGFVEDERAIHKFFKQYKIDGDERELFEPAKEILDYIRWLRDLWFVAIPEMTDDERDALPVAEYSEWCPGNGHTKGRPVLVTPMFGAIDMSRHLFDMGERVVTQDDFYTNQIIIEAARKLMGRIDLDPASHAVANKVVKATTFYTKTDNGLTKQWGGKVWINPPFSAWKAWVPRILEEWGSGRIEEMCVLSAMRTVTAQYFAPFVAASDAVCIIKGRIKFWGGKAGDSPDDGHAVFYFGKNKQGFRHCFNELGTTFYSGANQ